MPLLLGALIEVLNVGFPSWGLKAFALLYGFVLFVRTMQDPEWLLALAILYLPLSRLYPAVVAPGVNGTNVIVLLMLLAILLRTGRKEELPVPSMPASTAVRIWLVLSCLSIVHTGFIVGVGALLGAFSYIKAWLDQFLIFFGFLYLIRDGAMARRILIYMMLGTAVVLGLGFVEWLDKRDLATIERARLLGPQLQPNDFAAFLVIGVVPFVAFFVNNLSRWWLWSIVPFLLAFVRVLLATFSRGAYIGFGLACLALSYVRGKIFLTVAIAAVVGVFSVAPELIPESLMDRIDQSSGGGGGFEKELDSSSQTRIVLWNAAIDMTLESPILGKGFGMFPILKEQYTAVPVHEADNHNMYLYICSQMGIPALLAFLFILFRMFMLGLRLHRRARDRFAQTVGMTAAATVAGILGLNMFGSRMVDISVMMYFWVLLAVVSHLAAEEAAAARADAPKHAFKRTPGEPRRPALQPVAAPALRARDALREGK